MTSLSYRCKAGLPVFKSSRFRSRCWTPTGSAAEAQDTSLGRHDLQHEEPVWQVPGAVYGWPKNPLHVHGIANSILDLTATIRPHFAIVDAVIAMEGDGPIMGRPRPLGFVAMGSDPVAVDATCARVIGLDPDKIEYLQPAAEFLGVVDASRIEHRGESPDRYVTRFDVVPALEHLRLSR